MKNIKGGYFTDVERLLSDALDTANIYNKDRKFYYEFSKIVGENSSDLIVILKDHNGNVIMRQNATFRRNKNLGEYYVDPEEMMYERHVFSLFLFVLIQKGLDILSVRPISSRP